MKEGAGNRGGEGEKEAGKGFAAAVTDYGKAGTRSQAIPVRARPPTAS
jgi:hypothetical protein